MRRRTLIAVLVAVLVATGCTLPAAESDSPDSARPSWCRHYDIWERAYNESERIAARHGDHVPDWPADDLERWSDLVTDYGEAASRMWAAAPADAKWPDAHRLCG